MSTPLLYIQTTDDICDVLEYVNDVIIIIR